MRYSLVIFDLDGTLADSFPWFLRAVNDIARKYGFKPIANDDIEPLRRAGTREILKRLEVPFWKLPAIAAHARALKREQLGLIALFPGTDAMLRSLSGAGLTLALVSSDNEQNARRQLGASAEYFSHFACGASLFGKAARMPRASCVVPAPRPRRRSRSETRCATSRRLGQPASPAAPWPGVTQPPRRWRHTRRI